ncbi:hypothetical protein OG883_43725 [Streptomyces sp. NBC_01142]|uniref:hypothetical protein n=1 Tax=Streptomyces sp. NBC_01142 TaxID=2975865 RepID=UPI0022584FB2|nr:hypothetical protein [Streptomyces sp. NBC_01142]MCX4826551.1 hypothetical protein [Streptomyces sp. NBC_01142]
MNPRPAPAPTARRAPAAGPRRGGQPRTTTTVVYDCAHLRVRAREGDVLWFVRDVAAALGFRLPLTPGAAVPQVLVTTDELRAVMTAAGFRPPAAFTAWVAELPHRLPRPGSAPVPRR